MRVSKTVRSGVLACFMAMAMVGMARAQTSGLADPATVWDYADNPAAWGLFPDFMAVGLKAATNISELSDFSAGTFPKVLDVAYGIPGLLYRYRLSGSSESHELTSAFSYGKTISLGWRMRWTDSAAAFSSWGFQDVGLMVRPFAYASLSVMLEDVFGLAGNGLDTALFGMSVRPLAFSSRLESMLTLSVDARYRSGIFSLASLGARFVLGDWLGVYGRYEFPSSSLGIGVSIALSGLEYSAGYAGPATIYDPLASQLSLGQAFRLGRTVKPASRIFAKSVLYIDEPGVYAASPPGFDFDPGMGNETELWFDMALAAIKRAAEDKGIGWLVMVEPPVFESDARAQEFGRALSMFRDAGKPVYVYARTMDRLSYVYAAAGAELIALDPNGNLAISDVAAVSLYFKNLLTKIGIETYNLRSHDTKTAYNMLSESGMTDAERSMVERYIAGLAAQSYKALEAARSARLSSGAAAAIVSGPYLDPSAALKAGLIDGLMYRDEFDDAVKEKTKAAPGIDLKSYARERGLSWGPPIAKKVAIVYLSGNIIEGPGVAGQSIGDSATELLAGLREDASIAGVILRVDSGGGSALTSDHIAREVKKLRAQGKPVVVSMATYAASGGYYISAFADRIIAEAGTITGSIGVTGLSISAVGLLEKLGIGAAAVSAGDSGLFGNPFLAHREADDEIYRSGIDYIYGRFVDVVAEGRRLEKSRVDELGKGQIWLGSEALGHGLVDGLGGLDQAKSAMAGLLASKPYYQDYLPGDAPVNPFLSLLFGTRSRIATAAGPVSASIDRALRFADEVLTMGDGLLYLAPEYLYRERY